MTGPVTALWLTGLGLTAGLALLAALQLAGMLNNLLNNFPGSIGGSGWLIVTGCVAAGLFGLALALRLPARWALFGGLVLLVVIRVVATLLVDPPLVRDPAGYHRLATGVQDGECCFDYRPMGYPMMLAAAYSLGLSGKVVNLVAALLAGPLMWALGRRLGGERAGVVALYLYAITPSFVLLSGVLLTEPLYATLLLAALWAAFHTSRRAILAGPALGGLVLGLSQYVRATGTALAPAFLLPMLLRRAWREAGVLVLLMAVALAPVAVVTGGLSTSPLFGWTMLVGTNQQHDGTYNEDDRVLYASWGAEREQRAREEAVRRIVSDPVGFAALAVRKAHVIWASEAHGVYFAFANTAVPQNVRDALRLVSQAFYAPLFLLAVLALWRMRRAPPEIALVVLAIIASVALIHTFAEVQPRYHAHVVPLLSLLAASLVGSAPWAIRRASDEAAPNPGPAT